MLNGRGGIECDLTVTRLGAERFLIVTGTAFGRHDRSWIEQHAPDRRLGRGPRRHRRAGLPRAVGPGGPRDPRRRAAPTTCRSRTCRPGAITVGDVPCWALRVTYVGELGWELYPSAEYGLALWDTLDRGRAPHGLVPAGYRAIDSLRLEKGYRVWGADITSETDPYSAGLGFAVRADREFLGRDALPAPEGGPHRLVCLVLDDVRAVALGNEPVRSADGDIVGRVTSGGVGYSLGVSIAYAWLPVEHAASAPC